MALFSSSGLQSMRQDEWCDKFDKILSEATKSLENMTVLPPKRPKLDDSNTVLNSVLNISDISHLQASSGDIGVHQASAKHSPQVRSAGRGRARRSLGSLPSEQSKPGNQSSVPPGFETKFRNSPPGLSSLQFVHASVPLHEAMSNNALKQSHPVHPLSAPPGLLAKSYFSITDSFPQASSVLQHSNLPANFNNSLANFNNSPVLSSVLNSTSGVEESFSPDFLSTMVNLHPSVLVNLLHQNQLAAVSPLNTAFNMITASLPLGIDKNLLDTLSALPPAVLQSLLIQVQQLQQQQQIQLSSVVATSPDSSLTSSMSTPSLASMLKRSNSLTDYQDLPRSSSGFNSLCDEIQMVKEQKAKISNEPVETKQPFIRPRPVINRSKASHVITRHLSVPSPRKAGGNVELTKSLSFAPGENNAATGNKSKLLDSMNNNDKLSNNQQFSHCMVGNKIDLIETSNQSQTLLLKPHVSGQVNRRRSLQSAPVAAEEKLVIDKQSNAVPVPMLSPANSVSQCSKTETDEIGAGETGQITNARRKRPAYLTYSIMQLVFFSSSPFCRQMPPSWLQMAEVLPDVCVTEPSSFFDRMNYKSPCDSPPPKWRTA